MIDDEEIRRAAAEGRAVIVCTPTRFKEFDPPAASVIMKATCCGELIWVAPYQTCASVQYKIPLQCLVCQMEWFFRWGRL